MEKQSGHTTQQPRPGTGDAAIGLPLIATRLPRNRLPAFDAARGALMLLGIVFHAAMVYGTETWRIHDHAGGAAFAWIATGIHTFRMHGFFLIAGFFVAFGLEKRTTREYVMQRVLRLLLPLVSALLTFNVLELLVINFLSHGSGHPNPLLHLWFLLDLLILTVFAAALLRHGRIIQGIECVLGSVRNPVSLLALLSVLCIGLDVPVAFLSWWAGDDRLSLWGVTSLVRLANYTPFFVFGMLVFRSGRIRHVFGAIHPIWFLPALVLNTWLTLHPVQPQHWVLFLTELFTKNYLTWLTVAAFLSLFSRVFSRPITLVRWLADSSYPIYLSHEFFVVVFGAMLFAVDWPADVKFVVLIGVVFAASTAFAMLVQRVHLLQWLYLGRPLQPASQAPVAIAEPGLGEGKDMALLEDATTRSR